MEFGLFSENGIREIEYFKLDPRDQHAETPAVRGVSKEHKEDTSFRLNYRQGQKAYNNTAEQLKKNVKEEAVYASQIMTSPVLSVHLNQTLHEVWNMIQQKEIRHAPVLAENGQLIGIVSDRDILDFLLNRGTKQELMVRKVRDAMSQPVLTAHTKTEIRKIAQIFHQKHFSSLPIVDDSNRLAGIVTTSDIIKTVMNFGPLALWV